MKKDVLDQANKLVEIMAIHTKILQDAQTFDKYDKILIISSNHECFDSVYEQVVDYDKRNPGNTPSMTLGGGPKDNVINSLLDYESKSLEELEKKLEAL